MGWLKKAFKKVKKVVKKVGKVVKKIAKPLAIAAAVYFTGGAALGAMGSSWGALGSSIMSGLGSAGSALKAGGKFLAKKIGGAALSKFTGMGAGRTGPGSGSEGLYNEDGSFNWGGALGAGLDAYGSYRGGQQIQAANQRAAREANPFASQRGFYASKLRSLEADPSSIANTPGYKFAQSQGEQAIGRLASATGGRLGGKRMGDVLKFNNNLASQMFQSETRRYAGLAGANMAGGGAFYGAGAEAYAGGIQDAAGTLGHYAS